MYEITEHCNIYKYLLTEIHCDKNSADKTLTFILKIATLNNNEDI